MYQKNKLRKKFLKIRKEKYFDITARSLDILVTYLNKKYKSKKLILSLYYPSNFEFNILKIFENRRFKNFITLLPYVRKNYIMEFYKWDPKDILTVNKFGMLQPMKNKKRFFPNVILLPLLAFDKYKNRLGYGKGYYDRYLSRFIKINKKIETIGIAFAFQKHKKLPFASHDIKLDKIFTEKGFLK